MLRLLLALFLFVLGSLAAASAQNWVEFKPPGAGYRVEFPGTPKTGSEDLQIKGGQVKMTTAKYQVGGNLDLMSTYIAYPRAPADPQVVLDLGRDGGVASAKGMLREEKRLTIGGMPARRIVVDSSEDKQVFVGLMVVSGNRFYQVVAAGPRGQENSATVQRFIDSFALVP
jgi:hypothetical protein